MLACPINFISAGRLMPARIMSEANVVRKRWGVGQFDAGGLAMVAE
jgi:hypothetical protein